jgi:hypothetical protein
LDINQNVQGELEHRTPKSRYRRTDRKLFVRQLAQIERREARLRRIRARLSNRTQCERVPGKMDQHHHIGVSQNQYEHIGTFLQKNARDPAIKVRCLLMNTGLTSLTFLCEKDFLPKLKRHLLPRILSSLPNRSEDQSSGVTDPNSCDLNPVLFKHDRIYPHSLMRVNYTTYDVRRSQDVINPSTSHCNIMLLADSDDDDTASHHHFRYARVLGIYHANVVYVGPGMLDYEPRRMEFLWVRWYRTVDVTATGWNALKLDRVEFPDLADNDACGFIDPSDVLRGSHIIPSFARGRRLIIRDISLCARNSSDYLQYYVDR